MNEPQKPIRTPEQAQQIVHNFLIAATEEGSKMLGCTGVSFVTSGMGIWCSELAEVNPQATTLYLRAMADIFDPNASLARKKSAETRRRRAVEKIFAAVELAMAKPEGSA